MLGSIRFNQESTYSIGRLLGTSFASAPGIILGLNSGSVGGTMLGLSGGEKYVVYLG